jgi:ribosomal protein S18 acetylase RimI-like enzyme
MAPVAVSPSPVSPSVTPAIRNLRGDDCAQVLPVMDQWWGGRHVVDMLPKLFFLHFNNTSFAIDDPQTGKLVAFLVGFVSQSHPEQAYIHFAGVHPHHRKRAYARALYEKFCATARSLGCTEVHCATSPVNRQSIAFHTKIGFSLQPGDGHVDGVPVATNYDGRGLARVLFIKHL